MAIRVSCSATERGCVIDHSRFYGPCSATEERMNELCWAGTLRRTKVNVK